MKHKNMILIVGLGNPGKKYENTRHNLGFLVIDKILTTYNLQLITYNKKHNADISKNKIDNQEIILTKPQTYMNNSGQAVGSIAGYYKIKPENIWIIHDDIDLPLGKIRISQSSSAAGHKGVQSIIDHLGTKNFTRFRIGLKPTKPTKIPTEKYVLKNFTSTEKKIIQKTILNTVESIKTSLKKGLGQAMNEFN